MVDRSIAIAPIVCALLTHAACADSPFATRVMHYAPQPGQNVNNPLFNDPTRALGAPVGGGTLAADNSKVVTLGGFGGSITLGFDHAIVNRPPTPSNPSGADLIVFGNAFWVAGDPRRRLAEPGFIEVSRDANANGLADDPWYVIPASHDPASPQPPLARTVTFTGTTIEPSWLPPGRSPAETWSVKSYALIDALFIGSTAVLVTPSSSETQTIHGYADCAPTLVLGDFDGDNTPDITAPPTDPERFYTVPSNPTSLGIDHWSGGGEAVDIALAVDEFGQPANLTSIDFVRISTGVNVVRPIFGESSTEVAGVAEVRPRGGSADMGRQGGLLGPDGLLDSNDFIVFIDLFFAQSVLADIGLQGGLRGSDGAYDNNDFVVFVDLFFTGGAG